MREPVVEMVSSSIHPIADPSAINPFLRRRGILDRRICNRQKQE
ncbi:MAG: hypothetical protein K0Q90_2558 [Paenibacillaceae bacterium]|jgi:hypothetical protein|nr:hypothetical protein [Paenibacillaceae bacterium]